MVHTKKAVILLSGGLDSTTVLAMAKEQGYACYAMSFAYGQRHAHEIEMAKKVASHYDVHDHRIVTIDLRAFGGSALTDDIDVPKYRDLAHEDVEHDIPITYVPARNTIFLSFALGWAEVLGAFDIFIGANAIDYSGYPDCRPEYIKAFEKMANLATAVAVEGKGYFTIHTPIIELTKAAIVAEGLRLGVDYGLTRSCYELSDEGISCGGCDSCQIRRAAFVENGMQDPAPYSDGV